VQLRRKERILLNAPVACHVTSPFLTTAGCFSVKEVFCEMPFVFVLDSLVIKPFKEILSIALFLHSSSV